MVGLSAFGEVISMFSQVQQDRYHCLVLFIVVGLETGITSRYY